MDWIGEKIDSPDELLVRVGFLEARTAVALLDTDLFFAEASAVGDLGGDGRERRVLTFPSGGWLAELDVDLLVGRLGLGLGRGLAVGRGEDAEGHGDSGFKIQLVFLGGELRGQMILLARQTNKKNAVWPLASSVGKTKRFLEGMV